MSRRNDFLSVGDLYEIGETISLLNANSIDDDYIGWCSPLKSRFASPKKQRSRQQPQAAAVQRPIAVTRNMSPHENQENIAIDLNHSKNVDEIIDVDEIVARAKRQLELELTAERNQALSTLRKSTHAEYETQLEALRNKHLKVKHYEMNSQLREYERQFVEAFNSKTATTSLAITPTSTAIMQSVSKIKQQINSCLQQEVLVYAEELEHEAQQQERSNNAEKDRVLASFEAIIRDQKLVNYESKNLLPWQEYKQQQLDVQRKLQQEIEQLKAALGPTV